MVIRSTPMGWKANLKTAGNYGLFQATSSARKSLPPLRLTVDSGRGGGVVGEDCIHCHVGIDFCSGKALFTFQRSLCTLFCIIMVHVFCAI